MNHQALQLELEELKKDYYNLKSTIPNAQSKKEVHSIKHEMNDIRTRMTMIQCELRNGYSLQN